MADDRGKLRRKPPFIADLDSATSALQATSSFLHGRELEPLRFLQPAAPVVSRFLDVLPRVAAEQMYSWGGWVDAIPLKKLDDVDFEQVSHGVAEMYPKRRYPAVVIGSTNGAAVHLAAALGIPFIPQTLLVVVRRHLHPDEPRKDLEWARGPVSRLLANNPDVRVYQHHDSNQDRLMLRHMAYFRVKRLELGRTYEAFLRDVLEPGGTILSLECGYEWPSTEVNDRHIYQFGGWGGLTTEEYLCGGPRVEAHLERLGSPYRKWDPPASTGSYPEAEWGFDAELREDIERFARANGYRSRSLRFGPPQALSAPTAEIYREWYRGAGLPDDRLYVESFTHVHPHLTVSSGLVPYWSVFNDQPSLQSLEEYLERAEPYDEIYLSLFSNSIEGVGIASIEEWRALLTRARSKGRFLGVQEDRYPNDLASFVRHFTELKRLDAGYRFPERLTMERFESLLGRWDDQLSLDGSS